jgi:SAM-dependent methyltransferase
MRPDFSQRSAAAELMDADDIPYAVFRGCLDDLAKANAWTLGFRPTLDFVEGLHRDGRLPTGRPVIILDAGSGGGDLLAALDRWASRHGIPVRLVGVDLNPWSAMTARSRFPRVAADWVTGDIFEYDGPVDIVTSCLFTHHLPDARVAGFLRWMESRASTAWFVNDLHRHPFAYYGFGLLARLMRWHRFVRHDGPVSIARAFQASDWPALLAQAGLAKDAAKVRWRFPFRLCVERVK